MFFNENGAFLLQIRVVCGQVANVPVHFAAVAPERRDVHREGLSHDPGELAVSLICVHGSPVHAWELDVAVVQLAHRFFDLRQGVAQRDNALVFFGILVERCFVLLKLRLERFDAGHGG